MVTSKKTQKGEGREEKRKGKSKLNVIIIEFGSFIPAIFLILAGW